MKKKNQDGCWHKAALKLIKRKTGEHLMSRAPVPRCVDCGADEDDAYVGGEKCSYVAPKLSDAAVLYRELKFLIEMICEGERDVTVEDCDEAKAVIAKFQAKKKKSRKA